LDDILAGIDSNLPRIGMDKRITPLPAEEQSDSQSTSVTYHSVNGLEVPGVTPAQFEHLINELESTFFVSLTQVIEAAAYSLSMVVRHALGLSAQGGIISIIASNSIPGLVALQSARYLCHAGAAVHVVTLDGEDTAQPKTISLFQTAKQSLDALGVVLIDINSVNRLRSWAVTGCEHSQHILIGCGKNASLKYLPALSLLNEAICPVHCVQLPPGTDGNTGATTEGAIFASSTLSLGVPLNGLATARDRVGRHYICDISLPTFLHDEHGVRKALFHDQPVQTLLFEKPRLSH
jgi:NAD(P)H-hydrate repair Nnr-like enzyme with NAD(P)H-hydrate epimerase domain